MKTIIYSLLAIFLSFNSQAHADDEKICKIPIASFSSAGTLQLECAKKNPSDVLRAPFRNAEVKKLKDAKLQIDYKEIESKAYITSFEKVELTPNGEGYTVLGTDNHAYYLKTTKDNQIIGFQQGYEKSSVVPYCYKYKITKRSGLNFCEAEDLQKNIECIKKKSSDPILNPHKGRNEVSCDLFINSMLACSKDEASTSKCIKNIYAKLNLEDAPKANQYNKPLPGSVRGIADSDAEGDFIGEPDTGARSNSTKSRGSK